jgi:hypothetical protein
MGLAGFFGVVFESKGVISKYCGIRSYEFCVAKVVFYGWNRGIELVNYQLSKNAEMVLGRAS